MKLSKKVSKLIARERVCRVATADADDTPHVVPVCHVLAGEKIYFARCASCHGDYLGGLERAPALDGGSFLDSWHGKNLRRLLDRIDSMPPTEPKSLSPADAVAVLAFLVRTSELPSGTTALPTDRADLASITFERAKP